MKAMFTPRWIAGHVLFLTLVSIFIRAGFWQADRHHEAVERNARIRAAHDASPVTLAVAFPEIGADVREHQSIIVRGVYEWEDEVLIRGKSHGGRPGYHLLTPLRISADEPVWGGASILVERGFVTYDHKEPPVAVAQPPSGEVTVSGEIFHTKKRPETGLLFFVPRDPPEGVLKESFWIDEERLQPQMQPGLLPVYVSLREQQPANGPEPEPLLPEQLDNGPHLGYTIQWFGFAIASIIGYFFLMRRVVAEAREEQPV